MKTPGNQIGCPHTNDTSTCHDCVKVMQQTYRAAFKDQQIRVNSADENAKHWAGQARERGLKLHEAFTEIIRLRRVVKSVSHEVCKRDRAIVDSLQTLSNKTKELMELRTRLNGVKHSNQGFPDHAVSIPITLFKDGSQWCAVLPGFKSLQESPCGFSKEPACAVFSLFKNLKVDDVFNDLILNQTNSNLENSTGHVDSDFTQRKPITEDRVARAQANADSVPYRGRLGPTAQAKANEANRLNDEEDAESYWRDKAKHWQHIANVEKTVCLQAIKELEDTKIAPYQATHGPLSTLPIGRVDATSQCNIMQLMVAEFHHKFDQLVSIKPVMKSKPDELLHRTRLMSEELVEFITAASKGCLVDMVDALGDLLYVTFGTCVSIGVNIQPAFNAIHAANMMKMKGTDRKVMKGPHYKDPDIASIIREQLGPPPAPAGAIANDQELKQQA